MSADFTSMPIVGKWFTRKDDFRRVGSLNPRGRFTHYGINVKNTERGKPCVERWIASCNDRARGFKNPPYLASLDMILPLVQCNDCNAMRFL
jgi:hypothetical protein